MPADVVGISKITDKSSFLCKSSLVKDDENIWARTDGSEWDFDNWYGPEPNNAGGRYRFIEIDFSLNCSIFKCFL